MNIFEGRSLFDSMANAPSLVSKLAREAKSPEQLTESLLELTFGKERAAFKAYEDQSPCIREFQAAVMLAKPLLAEMGHIETRAPVFDHQSIKSDKEGYTKIRQSVKIMEEMLKSYRALTSLSNALAVGRTEVKGPNIPPIPIIRLRSDAAFKRFEGRNAARRGPSQQARAYAFELNDFMEDLVLQWQEAGELWRIEQELDKPTDIIYPHAQKSMNDFRREKNAMQPSLSKVEFIGSRTDASKKLEIKDLADGYLARKLSSKKEQDMIDYYRNGLKSLTKQWQEFHMWVPTNGGLPIETLLAFTAAHVKAMNALLKDLEHLMEVSILLERFVKESAAKLKFFEQENIVLPFCSFDLDTAAAYRDELLRVLGPHKSFHLAWMPQLLLRWQTDKLSKAIRGLRFVAREMQTWIAAHGDDPKKQGIHLRDPPEMSPRQILDMATEKVMAATDAGAKGDWFASLCFMMADHSPAVMAMVNGQLMDEDPTLTKEGKKFIDAMCLRLASRPNALKLVREWKYE